VLIAVVLIGVYFVQNSLVNKHQNDIKQGWLIVTYVVLFILFIGAVFGALVIWEYDFGQVGTSITSWVTNAMQNEIGTVIASLFTIFISLMIIRITKLALHRVGLKPSPLQRRKKTIAKVTQSIIKYVVLFLAIIIVLAMWNVNVIPALAGLGVAGIVIGLGAQKFINDLISGFFIIFEHHFDVGDIIEVSGFKGEVIDIGLKTTKIRNWRGEVKIINNGDVDNVSNMSLNPSIGIVDFGIAYKEDAQRTIDLLKVELPKLKEVTPEMIEDPQVLGVMELADSSVNLRVICKTLPEKHYGVERLIRQRIKELLDQNNIEIPFPQVVIHQEKDE